MSQRARYDVVVAAPRAKLRFQAVATSYIGERLGQVMTRIELRLCCLASTLMLFGATAPAKNDPPAYPAVAAPFDGTISILTYNIKGLPWPAGVGRSRQLRRIGERLAALRQAGHAPAIVVLQESFTAEAQSLGHEAGYRYVVNGPSAEDLNTKDISANDRTFAQSSHWWLGETHGKFVGSGLQILSDYPIAASRRVAFPSIACAGFDCLANKGALFATILIPGASSPIDVVTTHLNSRRASWTADARNIYAYKRRVVVLSQFIERNRDPRRPLIVAGDFNVGSAHSRQTALTTAAARHWGSSLPIRSAYDQYVRQGGCLNDDAAFLRRRARDWQFYIAGSAGDLALTGVEVPFGGHRTGTMLSDHVGYVARYRISPATALGRAERAGSRPDTRKRKGLEGVSVRSATNAARERPKPFVA